MDPDLELKLRAAADERAATGDALREAQANLDDARMHSMGIATTALTDAQRRWNVAASAHSDALTVYRDLLVERGTRSVERLFRERPLQNE